MRYILLCIFSFLVLSCSESMLERYPILTWETTKVDSILGLSGRTRTDSIGGFNSNKGYIDCNFNRSNIPKIIDQDTTDNIIDTISALEYQQAMCELVHSSKAILIFPLSDYKDLTIFKFRDGCEILNVKDTSIINLTRPISRRKDLKRSMKNSLKVGDHWYVNEKGTLFNIPG